MSGHAGLLKALEVLDARVQALEALLASEFKTRDDLRSRQNSISDQGQDLVSCLQETAAADPASFRFLEVRMRKLAEDQRNLQPTLAKAAIRRMNVQDALRSLLRQRLGLRLQMEKVTAQAPIRQTEAEQLHLLFEMQKRG